VPTEQACVEEIECHSISPPDEGLLPGDAKPPKAIRVVFSPPPLALQGRDRGGWLVVSRQTNHRDAIADKSPGSVKEQFRTNGPPS
jgi:hypothetical protein